MGVYKLSTAGGLATPRTNYSSFLAGNSAVEYGSYFQIATTTLSGSATGIDFNSIPATYKHLQIRGIVRDTTAGTGSQNASIQVNGSSAGYSLHYVAGNSTSVFTDYATSASQSYLYPTISGGALSNAFSSVVIDILDYANTNKYTTFKCLSGFDLNGTGTVRFASGVWQNTNAITSISLFPYGGSGNLAQYSSFALYGIKG